MLTSFSDKLTNFGQLATPIIREVRRLACFSIVYLYFYLGFFTDEMVRAYADIFLCSPIYKAVHQPAGVPLAVLDGKAQRSGPEQPPRLQRLRHLRQS